ncbi:MAG: N-6 DNA methylase [Liquorilactobacillus ghanensis]|uniref:N-6 DNA methylase n=1 Tax=Liquorilactobacillus ghanensis TaxID=399370 RepID=UPI0039E9D995
MDQNNKYMEKDLILKLLDSGDGWQASEKLMSILMDKTKREKLFRDFLSHETDVSYDWFCKFFNDEMAERTKKQQYFTPSFLSDLVAKIVDTDNKDTKTNFDSAAGTGSLTVAKWNTDRLKVNPLIYRPSDYFYTAEELKIEGQPSRALPFLLFNFLIRGMNGVVISGDSLSRKVSQIYFIQNDTDNMLGFSSLNVMPRTETVAKEFDVREWIDEPITHIESPSPMPEFLINRITGVTSDEDKKLLGSLTKMKNLIANFKTAEEMRAERLGIYKTQCNEIRNKIKSAIKAGDDLIQSGLNSKKVNKYRNRHVYDMVQKWFSKTYKDKEIKIDTENNTIEILSKVGVRE